MGNTNSTGTTLIAELRRPGVDLEQLRVAHALEDLPVLAWRSGTANCRIRGSEP
jgi:hypothetical protein